MSHVTVLGEAYPSMVHSRQDCDTIALAMPLRGSECMSQTARGCTVTGSSDSARVYWDVPEHAANEGESAMHMHGHLSKSLATALIGIFHIPSNYVVGHVTAQRKPPEVRICRLRNQSRVGTLPPSTSTPHWPAC